MSVERLDYDRVKILMHCTSEVEAQKRLVACAKEPECIAFIEGLKRGVFFDIGSNTGAYSLVAAANGHAVHAFEPPGPTYERLKQNVDLNDELRVIPHPILLGDDNADVDFSYSSMEPGAALHHLGRGKNTVTLPMRTLDLYVSEREIPYPDALKIDVDGSEHLVLAGAPLCLSSCRAVLVETDSSLPDVMKQVYAHLWDAGFDVECVYPHGRSPVSNVVWKKL